MKIDPEAWATLRDAITEQRWSQIGAIWTAREINPPDARYERWFVVECVL